MRKPKAIVLWGKANRGKTQTLNLVISKLCYNFGASVLTGTISTNKISDNCVVLAYADKRIGIITNGDNAYVLAESFNKLPNDCDLYICASRTKGSSCNFIKKNHMTSEVVWVEKYGITAENCELNNISFFQKKANDIQAQGIIEIIREILF